MIRSLWLRTLLAVSLVAPAATATVTAQESGAGPEGARWDLIAYEADGQRVTVPWSVDATLLLENGAAAGSTGCSDYAGTYTLTDDALEFGVDATGAEAACTGGPAAVEAGFLAALPQVTRWALADDVLELSDPAGAVLLEFAQPVVGLTERDVTELAAILDAQQAALERLDERLDSVRIGNLRDRIKALEAEIDGLRASSQAAGTADTEFTAAERTLLTAIPPRIRQTCTPRRDQNPAGTVAAAQCKPASASVRDMAYYLMDGRDARRAYEKRMDAYGVKPGFDKCARGKPGDIAFTGGFQYSGCYRNEDGRANLRYVVSPWDNCMNLKAGKIRIKYPTLYVAVLGPDADLAKLTKWAEPKSDARPTALFKRFKQRVGACGFTPPT